MDKKTIKFEVEVDSDIFKLFKRELWEEADDEVYTDEETIKTMLREVNAGFNMLDVVSVKKID